MKPAPTKNNTAKLLTNQRKIQRKTKSVRGGGKSKRLTTFEK